MRLWVVGKAGLLGQKFLSKCKERDIEAIGTGKEDADITDLSKLLTVAEQIRPTHIINCAAFTDVDRAEKERQQAYLVNAEGPLFLAYTAKKVKAFLIHISSDYVFDGNKNSPYKEDDSTNPQCYYGQTKLEGELKLLEEMPSACIIRTSWLFSLKGKNFLSTLFRLIGEKESLKVVSDQIGRVTDYQDLCDAIFNLLHEEGIFHFASTEAMSRYEIALFILQKARDLNIPCVCRHLEPVLSSTFPTLVKRPSYSVLCTEKYEKLTNDKPRSFAEILIGQLSHVE